MKPASLLSISAVWSKFGIKSRLLPLICLIFSGALFARGASAALPIADNAPALPALVSAGSDHLLKRWDSSGKYVGSLGSPDDTVNAIGFLPGSHGDILVSISKSGTLALWDVRSPGPAHSKLAHPGGAFALAMQMNGALIVTGGADQHIRLWNAAGERCLGDIKAHDSAVRALALSRDGSRLVSGGADSNIRFWKVKTGGSGLEYLTTIPAHDATVTALALSNDDEMAASVSEDGYLKTWHIEGGSLQVRVRVSNRAVLCVSYSPDGKTLATGDAEGKIKLWNAVTGAPMLTFSTAGERSTIALIWTKDGKMLITGGEDKNLRYWSTATGQQIAAIAAHDGAVRSVALVP